MNLFFNQVGVIMICGVNTLLCIYTHMCLCCVIWYLMMVFMLLCVCCLNVLMCDCAVLLMGLLFESWVVCWCGLVCVCLCDCV